jgi:hypothetical protein
MGWRVSKKGKKIKKYKTWKKIPIKSVMTFDLKLTFFSTPLGGPTSVQIFKFPALEFNF